MQNLLIFGASGHGKVILDILESRENVRVIGFIDSSIGPGPKIYGYEVLGTEDILPDLIKDDNKVKGIIGIGDNWTRKLMYDKIMELVPGFEFINAIHPTAVLSSHVDMGVGNVFAAGSIVNPGTKIGNFCIVNTKASVGHDCELHSFSTVAPGATLGGKVSLGHLSAVLIGSVVKNNVAIGNNSVLGAGSLLLEDLADHVLAYGNPATLVRYRDPEDPYL